jgi:SAM-dependent methyltransferase
MRLTSTSSNTLGATFNSSPVRNAAAGASLRKLPQRHLPSGMIERRIKARVNAPGMPTTITKPTNRNVSPSLASEITPWLGRQPANILEIGSASGSLLAAVREAGHQVTRVDLSPRFAEQARRLSGLELLERDFLKLPLPERAYDAMLLFGTISNLTDLLETFRRIGRLVRENDHVCLNFPHCDSWPARLTADDFGCSPPVWRLSPPQLVWPGARSITTGWLRDLP